MFGFLKQKSAVGYSGADTYKYIDKLINDNAKELKIITPYLGISYARLLLKLSKRKKIRLIVSGDAKKKEEAAVKLIIKKGRVMNWKPIFYGIVVAIVLVIVQAYPLLFSLVALMALYTYYVEIYDPEGRNIEIKISTKNFIHEKAYISNKNAIVGSANLTYSGTHRNTEHIEMIKNERRLRELNKHFDDLWKKI